MNGKHQSSVLIIVTQMSLFLLLTSILAYFSSIDIFLMYFKSLLAFHNLASSWMRKLIATGKLVLICVMLYWIARHAICYLMYLGIARPSGFLLRFRCDNLLVDIIPSMNFARYQFISGKVTSIMSIDRMIGYHYSKQFAKTLPDIWQNDLCHHDKGTFLFISNKPKFFLFYHYLPLD
jgi:hypothetical protein